jgi:hypothetical protein
MYLLEGTADLQHHYHLKMGDVLIFAQKDDKSVVLAGRPATRADAARRAAQRKPSPAPAGPGGKGGGKASKEVRARARAVRALGAARGRHRPGEQLRARLNPVGTGAPTAAASSGPTAPPPRPTLSTACQSQKAIKERNRRSALRRYGLTPEDVEAPTDGIFRAAPPDTPADAPNAVSQVRARARGARSRLAAHGAAAAAPPPAHAPAPRPTRRRRRRLPSPPHPAQVRAGRWVAAINVSGEVYQGFFPSQEDAADAVLLAGYTLPAATA